MSLEEASKPSGCLFVIYEDN